MGRRCRVRWRRLLCRISDRLDASYSRAAKPRHFERCDTVRRHSSSHATRDLARRAVGVVYETSDFRMFVRRIDTAEVHTVAGAAGRPVFWSPDSTTVFYSDAVGQLLKVRPALGVQEVVKTSTTPAEFFNLSESGTLLGTGRNQCLVFRPLSGGEPKALELPPQFKNGGCS